MVDVKNNFEYSFNLLKNNKSLFLPFFLAFVFFIASVCFFIFTSGIHEPIKDYTAISQEYNEYFKTEFANNPTELVSFEQYIQGKFNWEDYSYLLSVDTIVYFIISLLIWILLGGYLINIGYYQNAQNILNPKEKISFQKSFFNSSSFYFKYLIIRISIMFMLFIPIILFLAFSVGLLFVILPLGILLLFLSFIFIILWSLYIGLKFFFAQAILYVEGGDVNSTLRNSNSFGYLKTSSKFAKGKMMKILFVAFVVYGISAFINSISGRPLYSMFAEIFFANNIATIIFLAILIFLFLFFQGFLSAFLNIFVLKSYLEIKEENNTSSSD